MENTCWWIDQKRNKPLVVCVWYLFHILAFDLKIFIHIKWYGIWTKSASVPSRDLFCLVFSFISQSHWIRFSYLFFFLLLYLFDLDLMTHLQWNYFIIKLIATEKLTSFYSVLLDLSLGFPLLLIFEQRKEIQNEGSPFVQWLTLTSEMKDCNGALP